MDTMNGRHIEKPTLTDFTRLCLGSIHFAKPVMCDRGSVICALRVLNQTTPEQKTEICNGWIMEGNGRILDKIDKTDSNQKRTIDISLTDLLNVND